MARKKASDKHTTFKEKENERICRIIQRDFFGIIDNVLDDTISSTREQTRKKIAKNTPFWTAVIVLLLSLIGTTVAIALLVLDEGQHAAMGLAQPSRFQPLSLPLSSSGICGMTDASADAYSNGEPSWNSPSCVSTINIADPIIQALS